MKSLLQIICGLFSLVCFSQQNSTVDFKTAKVGVSFDVHQKKVYGEVAYEFEIVKDTDSIFLDAKNIEFENISLIELGVHVDTKHMGLKFHNDLGHLIIYNNFKKDEVFELRFDYEANPKKALYFIDWGHGGDLESLHQKGQIWTQGQGKYTSNWLPSIDDMNDKIEFDLSITFDKNYEAIANGKLIDKQLNDSTITWHYDMKQPMSSYLVALTIGKYHKKIEYSKSGIPLELYYYPEDSLKFEPTYRYTKQMFDFLEAEIGVPYPWQNYKQVPVKDFLYAGMENTGLTIFSDRYVVDSTAFVDRNYVNVNAHELAHQWFGDLVTETSGTHHWLQEGFATYYALLAEEDIFGEDYYWRLYEYAQELLEQDKAGQSTALLDPKSSSATFYKKGAWVLHLLREKIGDKDFRMAVKSYLQKYQFKNVETDDFIREVEKASGQNLREFVQKWLKSPELNYGEMEGYFYLTSIPYKGFLQLDCENDPEYCVEYIESSNNPFLRAEVIRRLNGNIPKAILNSKDVKVRQAIAQSLSEIPNKLKTEYESLLNDKSYLTIEVALYNLWNNFPEERTKYLNQTKGIQGFNDKNIRTLWLALALVTPDFEPENKQQFFEELRGYTDPKYHFEIRQNAFQYLNSIKACDAICKTNLEQASKHHVWQFSKFAKQLLKDVN